MDWATVPPWTTEHEQFLMKPSGRLNYLYNKWPRGKAITKLIMLSENMISVQTHDSTVSVSEVKDLLKKKLFGSMLVSLQAGGRDLTVTILTSHRLTVEQTSQV